MTQILTWLLCLVCVAAAYHAQHTSSAIVARKVAIAATSAATVLSIAGVLALVLLQRESAPERLRYSIPAIGLVGVIATAMAPVARHKIATFARVLLMLGLSFALVGATHLLVLFMLWAGTALVAWVELRSNEQGVGTSRLFLIYHLPSVVCMGLAGVLFATSHTRPAVLALVVALAIREALLPVHSWFPRFVQQSPMAIVVAFVAPQLGVWAHLDWLAPHIPHDFAHQAARIGAVTAILGAALGVVQTNSRRALAYLFLSQTALLAFGVENESHVAQAGAVLNGVVQALAFAGFAMTLSALEARRGAVALTVPSGNFARTPKLAVAFLVTGFSSVGLPLTLGFVTEDLLVQGSVHEFPRLGICLIIATALNGMNVARAFFLLFMGSDENVGERDLSKREFVTMTIVMATLLACGAIPGLVLRGLGI
jgi:formate hydrogenlyase subunit 3/multisubunit Na+/H+ antiporter MnhD subunit